MHRIIALLAALSLSACSTARNPNKPDAVPDQPTRIYDNDTGQLLNDSSGKNAAGGGRIVSHATSQIPTIAPALKPGQTFAYGRLTYNRVNAVTANIVRDLEDKYKGAQDALSGLLKTGAAGFKGDWAKAVEEGGKVVGNAYKEWQDYAATVANSPQPAQSVTESEFLITGEGSAAALVELGKTASASVQVGLAPSLPNSYIQRTKREDIMTAEEMRVQVDAIKEARLAAEAARRAAQPIQLPPAAPVDPPIVFPPLDPAPTVPPVTPPPSTNVNETIVLPGLPQ